MTTRGERLMLAIKARDIRKQQVLASKLRVNDSTVTRWKENKSMSLEHALAISAELDVSLDWLLLGRGTMDDHREADRALDADEGVFIIEFRKLFVSMNVDAKSYLTLFLQSLLVAPR